MITRHQQKPLHKRARTFLCTSSVSGYVWAIATVLVCTAVAAATFTFFDLTNLCMIYLLGVLLVATRFGRGPSVLASLLSVSAFDFFFVLPYMTLTVSDVQYVWTLIVMLAVALVISALTTALRERAETAREREKRTAALYAFSRAVASLRSHKDMLCAVVQHLAETFASEVVIMLPTAEAGLQPWGTLSTEVAHSVPITLLFTPDAEGRALVQWTYDHGTAAGLGTDTSSNAPTLYLPLKTSRGTAGVLGVRPTRPDLLLAAGQRDLLATFANQAALAFERIDLANEAQHAQVEAETERMRASLLASVSHDLRTPLATITGASSSLIEGGTALPEAVRADLAHAINDESMRLSRLVSNLLYMTRIEAKSVSVTKEWQPVEEVIGAVLNRLDALLASHRVLIHLPYDLPPVPIDAALIEQVFLNLLENSAHYTPADSTMTISATANARELTVTVADNGPGIAGSDTHRVFEKFYRVSAEGIGAGLGLAICRGIVEAHGGRIWLEQPAEGGTAFCFTLPLDGAPPLLPNESWEHEEPVTPR